MRHIFGFLLLIPMLWAPQAAASDCEISVALPAAEAIEAYQACLDRGLQSITDIRAALGANAFDNRDYRDAIDHFSEIIEAEERPGKAYFNRALALLELGKERRALADLQQANQILPGYSPAHFYRGVTLHRMRRYQQSIDAHDTALTLSAGGPALAPIYYERARSQLSLRNRDAALESLSAALVADPDYGRAYFLRASIHEKADALDLAIADYGQYIERNADSAEAYYNRGLIYRDLRQDHLAIKDFDRAIELNPRYASRASKGLTYLWPVFPVILVLLLG